MLYMATGKPAHFGCMFLSDFLLYSWTVGLLSSSCLLCCPRRCDILFVLRYAIWMLVFLNRLVILRIIGLWNVKVAHFCPCSLVFLSVCRCICLRRLLMWCIGKLLLWAMFKIVRHSVSRLVCVRGSVSRTQNKAVITNNSTTIGLFTTDTSDKNLQPKWAGFTCGHIQHMYSWWWVRLSPETCRVKPLRRIKKRNCCFLLDLFHYYRMPVLIEMLHGI